MSSNTNLNLTFDEVKQILGLERLEIEGGNFNRIYQCKVLAKTEKVRHCGTSIYYGIESNHVSSWHRIKSDEIWHYHAGNPVVQIILYPDGHWEKHIIGPDLKAGQRPQSIIPAGAWQATALLDQSPGSWGLYGATCFPGYEDEDFEHGHAVDLIPQYPDAEKEIIAANLNI
ncbi:cupin domain-containing protein [Histomonas meleagridis]|uniref:cupin domain-containing protein n=1 Tax=Histomonas meleagridis TaxID=135588 RepID=UPI0035595CCA|nr:cupin domain-containing protein [Histomonas meleagridis]KAH0797716.1 cupin domain-containing protein [Histomonas meleagridis]